MDVRAGGHGRWRPWWSRVASRRVEPIAGLRLRHRAHPCLRRSPSHSRSTLLRLLLPCQNAHPRPPRLQCVFWLRISLPLTHVAQGLTASLRCSGSIRSVLYVTLETFRAQHSVGVARPCLPPHPGLQGLHSSVWFHCICPRRHLIQHYMAGVYFAAFAAGMLGTAFGAFSLIKVRLASFLQVSTFTLTLPFF